MTPDFDLKPRLTVVTPCSRPQNLPALVAGLREAERHFDLMWRVVVDGAPGGPEWTYLFPHSGALVTYRRSKPGEVAGHAQANHALDAFSDGLVWRLDDDNLPVPGFFERLRQLSDANPKCGLFLFAQLAAGRYDEARWPGDVAQPVPQVGVMDTAQFVFRREALGDLRFDANDYRADGVLAAELYAQVGHARTLFWPEPLTQYNVLARTGAGLPLIPVIERKVGDVVTTRVPPLKKCDGSIAPHFWQNIDGFFHCAPLYRRVIEEASDGARFVEVGVWRGQSAAFMGVEIARSGKQIQHHAVDSFEGTPDGTPRPDTIMGALFEQLGVPDALYEGCVLALAPVAEHVRVVRAMSSDAAREFEGGSLDFVFLDADHSEAGVRADILAWLPKVRPGGLLAGDDYCHPDVGDGVRLAVDALLPGAVVPERFEDHVSGWWEYRKPVAAAASVCSASVIYTEAHVPKISIITPSFGTSGQTAQLYTRFLVEAYESLFHQTELDWEWVISNVGEPLPEKIAADSRVRRTIQVSRAIGTLKRGLSEEARAPFIVELDHDDVIRPDALEKILTAFTGVDFVYSDFAEFKDETLEPHTYRQDCGWVTYGVTFRGRNLLAHSAPPVTSQNLRWVDWSPNHVRAWRASAYKEVGGHNPKLAVGDDHDLIVRFFLAGKRFRHVAECLYFYRIHTGNTVGNRNAEIRAQVDRNYETYRWRLAECSGTVFVQRSTACKNAMRPGEWLFLRCPIADWYNSNKIPKLKGDFAVARCVSRDGEVHADLIRLGEGYDHMGPLCGD